jgi:hypothetical protein
MIASRIRRTLRVVALGLCLVGVGLLARGVLHFHGSALEGWRSQVSSLERGPFSPGPVPGIRPE